MPKLKVIGQASLKTIAELDLNDNEMNQNVLTFLQGLKIPIASSCNGEGICKKCVINKNVISCEKKLFDLLENNIILIEVSYL